MVLRLKPRESRSLPGLRRTEDREQNAGIRRRIFSDPCPLYSVFRSRHHKQERRERKLAAFFLLSVCDAFPPPLAGGGQGAGTKAPPTSSYAQKLLESVVYIFLARNRRNFF